MSEKMPDDPHIISEMLMAYISAIHYPEHIRDFGVSTKETNAMRNVLALLVGKGYERADLAQPAPASDAVQRALDDPMLNDDISCWATEHKETILAALRAS